MSINKEHSLAISKILNCYLNTQVNDLFDLAENMKALNNFQVKINELQDMKNANQIEQNGLALILLRKYVMEEKFGKQLMRNLIRQYYDLNDEQILKYENCAVGKYNRYFITNFSVYIRKGIHFHCDNHEYFLSPPCCNIHNDFGRNCTTNKYKTEEGIGYFMTSLNLNPNADSFEHLHKNGIIKNPYIDWSKWDIDDFVEMNDSITLHPLLNNCGYIAWQGIDNIEQTLRHIQQLNNKNRAETDKDYITDETIEKKLEYYTNNIYKLYSYLPLQASFVLEHQDELDWGVMELNPRIEWTFPLVQLLLRKHALLPEPEQSKGLKGNQSMFDKLFKPILNDEVISDLEKLYDM